MMSLRTGATGLLAVFSFSAFLSAVATWDRDTFRFVLLGDRTGETQPGVFERVLKQSALERPSFYLTVGDSIQGTSDATAEAQWRAFEKTLAPYKRIPFYLTAGNHDIWSRYSEKLFRQHSGHPVHYSFDYGTAHFTVLDNSRTEQFAPEELEFLENDLKSHRSARWRFVVSHRPSWIFHTLLKDGDFPLQHLAKQYGVEYVFAGHLHEMLHHSLDGVEYVSMASSGGHLRATRRFEDGWFFGYAVVALTPKAVAMEIHSLDGRVTSLKDWGAVGLSRTAATAHTR